MLRRWWQQIRPRVCHGGRHRGKCILYLRMCLRGVFMPESVNELQLDLDSLPARQRDVLDMIIRLTDSNSYPPTLAELAKALGLKNRMTVAQHVAALKK